MPMPVNTIAARLSIRPGTALWFSPIKWLHVLGPLPPGVTMTGEFAAAVVAVTFASDAASARWFLDRYRTSIGMPPVVWLCYPTRGRPDFNRASLAGILAGHGLAIVGEETLDAAWSAARIRPRGLARP
jgi:hypothetical protein